MRLDDVLHPFYAFSRLLLTVMSKFGRNGEKKFLMVQAVNSTFTVYTLDHFEMEKLKSFLKSVSVFHHKWGDTSYAG